MNYNVTYLTCTRIADTYASTPYCYPFPILHYLSAHLPPNHPPPALRS